MTGLLAISLIACHWFKDKTWITPLSFCLSMKLGRCLHEGIFFMSVARMSRWTTREFDILLIYRNYETLENKIRGRPRNFERGAEEVHHQSFPKEGDPPHVGRGFGGRRPPEAISFYKISMGVGAGRPERRLEIQPLPSHFKIRGAMVDPQFWRHFGLSELLLQCRWFP